VGCMRQPIAAVRRVGAGYSILRSLVLYGAQFCGLRSTQSTRREVQCQDFELLDSHALVAVKGQSAWLLYPHLFASVITAATIAAKASF
jgi:hypothetical protein